MKNYNQPFAGSSLQDSDVPRLERQIDRVRKAMIDGEWRTLCEIETRTGDPQASISAQLRNLRKPDGGNYVIEKRKRGGEGSGLYEYRMSLSFGSQMEMFQ